MSSKKLNDKSVNLLIKKDILLDNLETIASKLDIEIIYDNIDGIGGLCKLNGKNKIIINDILPIKDKISILANEMKRFDLDNIYIHPKYREFINNIDNVKLDGFIKLLCKPN